MTVLENWAKNPSLSSGLIKRAKNSVETDLPEEKFLTFPHLLTLPFTFQSHKPPAVLWTQHVLPTPPGLCTCCFSARNALSSTAYLKNFYSSFKISKHPETLLLLLLGRLKHSLHYATYMYPHCSNHLVVFYIFSCLLTRLCVSWEQRWDLFPSVLHRWTVQNLGLS